MVYQYPAYWYGPNVTRRSIDAQFKGKLTFEETDLGPTVAQFAPGADSDYEIFSTIENEDLEKLVVELVKDKFGGQVAFRQWLEHKDIKYTFFSW